MPQGRNVEAQEGKTRREEVDRRRGGERAVQAPLPHASTAGALSAAGELKKALAGARAGFLDAGNCAEKRRKRPGKTPGENRKSLGENRSYPEIVRDRRIFCREEGT